jgi:hypothetical protein
MANDEARERIRALFPGEEFKGLRHSLFVIPDFLKSDPTDEQIKDQAALILGTPKPESAPEVAQENPTLEGEILGPEASAEAAERKAQTLATQAAPVVVKTAEDYEQASLGFAKIKKMLADNEKDRVKLTAPILQVKRNIDDRFKAAEKILLVELQRYELPMVAFKAREREDLRKQEAEAQRIKNEAEAEAQRIKDEAATTLREATQAVVSAPNPFLAAILEDDLEDAKDGYREALHESAALVKNVSLPANYVAPVTAVGTKTSYPLVWEIIDPNLVPRNLCSPDPVLLNALMKVLRKDFPDITKLAPGAYPGVSIKEQIRIGGR